MPYLIHSVTTNNHFEFWRLLSQIATDMRNSLTAKKGEAISNNFIQDLLRMIENRGSSNRPWLIRQTGPIINIVTAGPCK